MKDSWYWKNRDKIRAERAVKYAANPGPAKERANKWRKANPERHQQLHEEYRAKHGKELAAKQAARYHADPDTHRAKFTKYREANRPMIRRKSREKSAAITDVYVREQLAKYSTLSMQDFPQELVDAKRLHIQLKRITKAKPRHEKRN